MFVALDTQRRHFVCGFLPHSAMLESIRAEALSYRVYRVYKKLGMHPATIVLPLKGHVSNSPDLL